MEKIDLKYFIIGVAFIIASIYYLIDTIKNLKSDNYPTYIGADKYREWRAVMVCIMCIIVGMFVVFHELKKI